MTLRFERSTHNLLSTLITKIFNKMKYQGAPSLAMMLWASVTSFLCAPTGVLGRTVPGPCPALCSDDASDWSQHHRRADVASCERPIHFEMSILRGAEPGVDVRACSEEAARVQLRSTSSGLETRAEEKVDFQIVKRTSGMYLKRDEVDIVMDSIDDSFADGIPGPSPLSVEVDLKGSGPDGEDLGFNITMGAYARRDIDPKSLINVFKDFGSRNTNGTSTFAIQRCGEGVPEHQSIGFVLDGNNDRQALSGILGLWADGKCIIDYESQQAWNGVAVNVRSQGG